VLRRATGVALLLLVLVLVACGGGDEVSGPKKSMTVVGTEMAFSAPDHVPAGDYQVAFQNAGTQYHELAFKNPSGKIVTRRSIAGGQFMNMDVKLTPGTWELACYEPGHYEAGMHKQLIVDKA
jgi:uncharacterized cupredoxin-like copper-binding protein